MLKSINYILIVLLTAVMVSSVYSQQTKYETVSAKEGKRCTVCGVELSENDYRLGRKRPPRST